MLVRKCQKVSESARRCKEAPGLPGVVRMCKGPSGVARNCLESGHTRTARACQELTGVDIIEHELPGVERRLSGVDRGCQGLVGVGRGWQGLFRIRLPGLVSS